MTSYPARPANSAMTSATSGSSSTMSIDGACDGAG